MFIPKRNTTITNPIFIYMVGCNYKTPKMIDNSD